MKDRRIQKSKDSIMNAFIKLMGEKDFERITINQIAECANVNRGTIYLHYTDKYDLLDKCISTHLNKIFDVCINNSTDSGNVSSQSTLFKTFEYIQKDSVFFHTMLSNKGVTAFSAQLQKMIEARVEAMYQQMKIDKRIKKDFAVQFLSSAIVGLLTWWIVNSFPYSSKEMVSQIHLMFKQLQLDFTAID